MLSQIPYSRGERERETLPISSLPKHLQQSQDPKGIKSWELQLDPDLPNSSRNQITWVIIAASQGLHLQEVGAGTGAGFQTREFWYRMQAS